MAQSLSQEDMHPQRLDRLLGFGLADDVALIAKEGVFTYADLKRLTEQVAAGLRNAGAQPGDRVASWMGKTLASAVLPFACARAGLVHVPINPLLKAAQVQHILSDSGAVLLITLRDRLSLLDTADKTNSGTDNQPRYLSIENDWPQLAATPTDQAEQGDTDVQADALAALLYTSGSTGRPKGVMLSHMNLWTGAEAVADYLKLRREDRVLAVLPFSFDYGLSQMLSMFRAGGCVVLHDYLLAKSTIKVLEKHGITVLAGVPPLWTQLIGVEWPESVQAGLRVLTNSGGAMSPVLSAALRQRCPEASVYLMYGLTEAFRSTYLDPALVDEHPQSIGKAIPYAEVLIVRPDGEETVAGEVGELVHCGPLVAQGYWKDPVRTAERFRPAPSVSRYGGLAVWSGDQAMRDADGLISFVGRRDEMIKTAGYRVSPTEVEEAVLASAVVRECVAFGVPHPQSGQSIYLVASAVDGLDDRLAEEKLWLSLRSNLPAFMLPATIEWRQMLPRNPNGKIDRTKLKAEIHP